MSKAEGRIKKFLSNLKPLNIPHSSFDILHLIKAPFIVLLCRRNAVFSAAGIGALF
jgi:hypothetical protein